MTDIYNARSSYPRLSSYASYPQQHQQPQNLNQQFNNPPESNHDYYPNQAHDDMDDAQQQGDKHDSTRTQSATFLTKLYTYASPRPPLGAPLTLLICTYTPGCSRNQSIST